MNTKTAAPAGADSAMQRRLEERLLLGRRVEGDRLVLADATLLGALDGSRPLTAGERAALQASPLTARRLRQRALERRAQESLGWRGSHGRLRAASSGELDALRTDDGWFTLHFTAERADETAGEAAGWRAILQLAADAPFAPALLAARAPLRVLDGAGNTILEGRLDADGECEAAWPFGTPPASHLQACGAAFAVEPLAG
jgi:xanthine/CO dehydrogenase XdhC/CoxF family maturation factor